MKIAMMTNNYKPFTGGVPISIERLKKGLEQLGHQVTVFAPTYKHQIDEQGVVRYGNLSNHFVGGIVLPNPFDPVIEETFQKGEFDIIHVHHPFLIGNMAMHLSRKYGVPIAFTYHTQYEQYLSAYAGWAKPLTGLMSRYLCYFLNCCDYVLAPTKGMQEYLHSICDVPYDKMEILPTGLTTELFNVEKAQGNAIRKQYQAEHCPLFISVSRMAQEKNIPFLINCIAGVKALYPYPFKVLMIGDGPDKNTYECLCKEKNLEDIVFFTGKIPNEEIAPYFSAADAFLFASKTETQGIVLLEAFAGKTPVYAVDADGVRDLVQNGVNGRLCPDKEADFVMNLLDFLLGKDDIAEMSRHAYETALQFREEAVADKAAHIYNEIIVKSKRTCANGEHALKSVSKRKHSIFT